jgi:hypothetical protein
MHSSSNPVPAWPTLPHPSSCLLLTGEPAANNSACAACFPNPASNSVLSPNERILPTTSPLAAADFLADVTRKGELMRSGLREALAVNPHIQVRCVTCCRTDAAGAAAVPVILPQSVRSYLKLALIC